MGLMGWSHSSMAIRYEHLTPELRRDIARQVDGLLWTPSWTDETRARKRSTPARVRAGQRWWPGAGSNRRPSDFQFKVHLIGVELPGTFRSLPLRVGYCRYLADHSYWTAHPTTGHQDGPIRCARSAPGFAFRVTDWRSKHITVSEQMNTRSGTDAYSLRRTAVSASSVRTANPSPVPRHARHRGLHWATCPTTTRPSASPTMHRRRVTTTTAFATLVRQRCGASTY